MSSLASNMVIIGIFLSLCAGLAITAGAWLASKRIFHSHLVEQEFSHGVTAFGGGALISAIAFVLIPESMEDQSALTALVTFAAGGLSFMVVDILLARLKSRQSQFFAMMLDFIPEAILLGVVIERATGNLAQAIFITLVIMAQNLPEGYSAYKEMASDDQSANKKLLRYFLIVGLTGPLYLLLGTEVFVELPQALAMIMTFCAGGILYLVFEDIAPRVAMEKTWLPPIGAVGGFMVGLAGYLFVG